MGSVAFLFAGQGAQHPAMGVDLIETSPAAEVFAIADEVRPGTSEQCRSASKEELSQTENTQPCAFVHDLAAAAALRERGVVPAACAGFSLGEVAALTFAGAFDTRAGFELVCERAALADGGKLIFPKLAHGGVTVAFSKVSIELSFKER